MTTDATRHIMQNIEGVTLYDQEREERLERLQYCIILLSQAVCISKCNRYYYIRVRLLTITHLDIMDFACNSNIIIALICLPLRAHTTAFIVSGVDTHMSTSVTCTFTSLILYAYICM